MTKRTTEKLSVELGGSLEQSSWIAHYNNFCYKEHDWVLFELEPWMYGVVPRELCTDMPEAELLDPIPLQKLQETFRTDMLDEINWKGSKHEFWRRVLGKIESKEESFIAFLKKYRFPLEKVEAYLKSKEL